MKNAFRSPDIDDSLIKISDVVPHSFRSIFKYDRFNAMQSIILPQAMQSDVNMVIAAPTGSGKTVVHELAVLRLLLTVDVREIKCVFIAPNKALCQQRCDEWQKKFGSLGLSVMEVTGDVDMSRSLQLVAKANIIVTTPEKWDSLTRSWRRHIFLLGAIDLLLLDEVHHLGEERGPTLETVVVRMRILCEAYAAKLREGEEQQEGPMKANQKIARPMRIIALSATLPNLADIGDWLRCAPESVHFFDEGFRPVPLTVHTLSYGSAKNPFLFERSLDDKVFEVVKSYSGGKQTLVFCSSKKGTENLSKLLLTKMGSQRKGFQSSEGEKAIQDSLLRDLVSKGFGYHHGGLPPDDRAAVEESYLSGRINVLCSTSTLAHGVNLPAHLVIIKGTYCWRGGAKGYETLARSDVIQMMGRAGRPGFDTEGVAVIMTSSDEKRNYDRVSLSADVVESHLPAILIEAICAEITQTVIGNVQEAIGWLKSTFFYVRVKKNPGLYGFDIAADTPRLDSMLMEMCTKALSDLSVANIIKYDSVSHTVEPLAEAHIMTRHMITFKSMVLMMNLPRDCDVPLLFKELSNCDEMLKPLRRNEKAILNGFMKGVRYPVKSKVQDSSMKGYVLMLAAVDRLVIPDFSLRVEQSEIVEVALRVLAALQSLCSERCIGRLLETAVLVDRALRVRMWETDYGSVYFQCQGLTDTTKKGLNDRQALTLSDLHNCSQFKVQELLACSAFESKQILLFTTMCEKWTLDLRVGYGLNEDNRNNGDNSNAYNQGTMRIEIVRAYAIEQRISQNQVQLDLFGQPISSSSSEAVHMELKPPTFNLICYGALTSTLLCHRRLDFNDPVYSNNDNSVTSSSSNNNSSNYNSSNNHRNCESILLSYTVPLPADTYLGDVKCVLLSSVVGLDTALMPRSMVPSTPKTFSSLSSTSNTANAVSKGSTKLSTSNASTGKNEVGVAVGSRIVIKSGPGRVIPPKNSPDGDMRSWMVKKSEQRAAFRDSNGEIDDAQKVVGGNKGESKLSSTNKSNYNSSRDRVTDRIHEGRITDHNGPRNRPLIDSMMDFTSSGYESNRNKKGDYFGEYSYRANPVTPADKGSISGDKKTAIDVGLKVYPVITLRKQQHEEEQQGQHPVRATRNDGDSFIAYDSDEFDDDDPSEFPSDVFLPETKSSSSSSSSLSLQIGEKAFAPYVHALSGVSTGSRTDAFQGTPLSQPKGPHPYTVTPASVAVRVEKGGIRGEGGEKELESGMGSQYNLSRSIASANNANNRERERDAIRRRDNRNEDDSISPPDQTLHSNQSRHVSHRNSSFSRGSDGYLNSNNTTATNDYNSGSDSYMDWNRDRGGGGDGDRGGVNQEYGVRQSSSDGDNLKMRYNNNDPNTSSYNNNNKNNSNSYVATTFHSIKGNTAYSPKSSLGNSSNNSSNSKGSTGGACSSELAMLRRKNIQLQLDTIPIKRMRTAASPGFLRLDGDGHTLSQHSQQSQHSQSLSQQSQSHQSHLQHQRQQQQQQQQYSRHSQQRLDRQQLQLRSNHSQQEQENDINNNNSQEQQYRTHSRDFDQFLSPNCSQSNIATDRKRDTERPSSAGYGEMSDSNVHVVTLSKPSQSKQSYFERFQSTGSQDVENISGEIVSTRDQPSMSQSVSQNVDVSWSAGQNRVVRGPINQEHGLTSFFDDEATQAIVTSSGVGDEFSDIPRGIRPERHGHTSQNENRLKQQYSPRGISSLSQRPHPHSYPYSHHGNDKHKHIAVDAGDDIPKKTIESRAKKVTMTDVKQRLPSTAPIYLSRFTHSNEMSDVSAMHDDSNSPDLNEEVFQEGSELSECHRSSALTSRDNIPHSRLHYDSSAASSTGGDVHNDRDLNNQRNDKCDDERMRKRGVAVERDSRKRTDRDQSDRLSTPGGNDPNRRLNIAVTPKGVTKQSPPRIDSGSLTLTSNSNLNANAISAVNTSKINMADSNTANSSTADLIKLNRRDVHKIRSAITVPLGSKVLLKEKEKDDLFDTGFF